MRASVAALTMQSRAHLNKQCRQTEPIPIYLGSMVAGGPGNFFEQGLATVGFQGLSQTRGPAVGGAITQVRMDRPFVVGGQDGILFDIRANQLGPIGD